MDVNEKYNTWLKNVNNYDLFCELESMTAENIVDSFYCDLSFGTGGLRGIMGAGTNRMNVYMVNKATQGLSNYLLCRYKLPSVVIGYDSRLKSDVFAKSAASVLVANGIKVFLFPEILPVSTISFSVRHLKASAGIMITASHNPRNYNGYKVYGSDGCQITTEAASEIQSKINVLDLFKDIKIASFEDSVIKGDISFIDDTVLTSFIDEVKKQSILYGEKINKNVNIVYTPLNGTGLKPITRILSEEGFYNLTLVKEQKDPDGNFPTCPYPNPEIKEAMSLGIEYSKSTKADILLATDPDCDRCGIAVKGSANDYQLLSGNEVGLLLLDFICAQRVKHCLMPKNPIFVKTIVTTDLAEKIASNYGVKTINVLTGFKFIGEVIGKLEKLGRLSDYIFGFEESYGYLSGSYVRDKDGVNAVLLICEMFAYYKSQGISLLDKLYELYKKYGYCLNTLHSYNFDGSEGMSKMKKIMEKFHRGLTSIAGIKVFKTLDYSTGIDDLPPSNVLKFILENGSIIVRPSGTEPKLKIYISVTEKEKLKAIEVEKAIKMNIEEILKNENK